MQIARVVGTTVATIKDEQLVGRKLMIVREADERGNAVGKPYVAVDTVDAGAGDLVLVAAGSSARQTTITRGKFSGASGSSTEYARLPSSSDSTTYWAGSTPAATASSTRSSEFRLNVG